MFDRLTSIFQTATYRQTLTTSIGTGINGILGIAFYFFLAAKLGSMEFGRFALLAAIIALLVPIFDLGGDQGIVKFQSDPVSGSKIVGNILAVKLFSGLLAIVLFIIFGQPIIRLLISKVDLMSLAPLVGVGIASQLLFSFSTAFLQASQRYFSWSLQNIGANLLRLVLTIVFFFLHALTANTALIIYVITPLIGFLLFKLFNSGIISLAEIDFSLIKKVFSFNLPIAGSGIISAVTSRIDNLLVGRLLDFSSTGIYSLCVQSTSSISQLASALGVVTSPKFSSFSSSQHNFRYLLKSTAFAAGLVIPSALLLVGLGYFLFPLTGKDFTASFPILIILISALSVFLITVPLRDSLLYFHTRPRFFLITSVLQLILTVGFSLWLIPQFGMLGAAGAVLANHFFMAVISLGYYLIISHNPL